MQYILQITCSCIAHLSSFYLEHLFICCVPFLLHSLFSFLSMSPKKSIPSNNPISHHGSSFSSSSLVPDSVRFRDEKAKQDFYEKFSDWVIHSERHVILSDFLDTPLPNAFSSQGWASLYEIPKRCPNVFIQEFYSNMHAVGTFVPRFTTILQGTSILVTPKFISKVLHVLRVVCLDYPSHTRLRSIPRDKMTSLFCEKAMVWGETLNFSTTKFAKGPRILNMVMTFVLTPRSHYNTITKPCAHFLLSLLNNLSIDFHSHMIESMISIYRDTTTRDKLIFPSAITHILSHVHVTIPPPLISIPWVTLARNLFKGVMHSRLPNNLVWSLLRWMLPLLLDLLFHRLLLLLLE